jgi:hypothetical protein
LDQVAAPEQLSVDRFERQESVRQALEVADGDGLSRGTGHQRRDKGNNRDGRA